MDSRGYIRITGRVKEMIIRGGENLFPAEIENVLLEHPLMTEVAVVGIPDDKWGEVVACFIRADTTEEIDTKVLHRHCRQHLSPKRHPLYGAKWKHFRSPARVRSRSLHFETAIWREITSLYEVNPISNKSNIAGQPISFGAL